MGQIKNIKLHIVTDIKTRTRTARIYLTIIMFGLIIKLFMKEFKHVGIKDRGQTLLNVSTAAGVAYATWYTYYLAAYGPEVNYLRGSNGDPYERYGTDYAHKWRLWTTDEIETIHLPRPAPEEAFEAIGRK